MTALDTEIRAVEALPTTEWKHLPALDGMRAAAVIAVLVFHAGYLQGGFLGVDLFFVLSGFLITSLLIRDAGTAGGIGLAAFWGRRFRRLLPAVLAMIAIVTLWAWLFGSSADLAGVKADGPWAVLYLANWHSISASDGYWASFAEPSMFDHLWSLAIEEQFYLLWPIVLVAVWAVARRPHRALLVLAVVGVAAALAAMLMLYDGAEPTRVYMGTDTRAASLLAGVLVATGPVRHLAARLVTAIGRRLDLVLAVVSAAIVWSWVAVDGASSALLYRGGLLAHSLACALVIALIVAADRGRVVSCLSWRPLVWIGVLSYGLYLWHWPIYVVLSPERVGFDGPGLLVLRIGLSFGAAVLSYRWVEDPIRRRAPWARGRSGLVALVVAIVAVLSLMAIVPDPPVEIAAFDPSSLVSPSTTIEGVNPTTRSSQKQIAAAATRPTLAETTQDTTRPPAVAPDDASAPQTSERVPAALPAISSVVWAGDSVAYDVAPAVVASLSAAGLAVDDLEAYPGFRLVTDRADIDLGRLVPTRAAAVGAEVALVQISNWDTDVDSEVYEVALIELADALDAIDTLLVIVAMPPTSDDDVNAEVDRLLDVAAAVADGHDNVQVLDSRAMWGSPGVQDLDGDGTPERKSDLTHVCPSGAARFGVWLVTELDQRAEGLTPGDPTQWADALWVFDERYDDPVGACAPVG